MTLDRKKVIKQIKEYLNTENYTEIINLCNSATNNLLDEDITLELIWATALNGNLDEALEICFLYEREFPDNPIINWYLGKFHLVRKEFKLSEKYFKEFIAKCPNDENGYIEIGNLRLMFLEYEMAEKVYLEGLDHIPNSDLLNGAIGHVCFKLEKFELAHKHFMKAKRNQIIFNLFNIEIIQTSIYTKNYKVAHALIKRRLNIINYKNEDPLFASHNTAKLESELLLYKNHSEIHEIKYLVSEIKNILIHGNKAICHYSNIDNTYSLIEQDSCFRLSEASLFNDPSEGTRLYSYLNLLEERNPIRIKFQPKPFIGCFVQNELNNDLNLWRSYGNNGNGSSIVFFPNKLIENYLKEQIKIGLKKDGNHQFEYSNLFMRPDGIDLKLFTVCYVDHSGNFYHPNPKIENRINSLMSKLKTLINSIKDVEKYEIQKLIAKLNYLFKDSQFKDEKEIRLIVESDFKFEVENKKVFINMPKFSNCIIEICLGPKVENRERTAAVLHYALRKNKGNMSSVWISTIPYR